MHLLNVSFRISESPAIIFFVVRALFSWLEGHNNVGHRNQVHSDLLFR